MRLNNTLIYALSCLLPMTACADQSIGLGGVATNLMMPIGLFAGFMHSGCYLIGSAYLFACIVKYVEHRRNPLMVPLSTVFFLLLAGLLLVCLPFIAYVTPNGIPYNRSR